MCVCVFVCVKVCVRERECVYLCDQSEKEGGVVAREHTVASFWISSILSHTPILVRNSSHPRHPPCHAPKESCTAKREKKENKVWARKRKILKAFFSPEIFLRVWHLFSSSPFPFSVSKTIWFYSQCRAESCNADKNGLLCGLKKLGGGGGERWS